MAVGHRFFVWNLFVIFVFNKYEPAYERKKQFDSFDNIFNMWFENSDIQKTNGRDFILLNINNFCYFDHK